MIEEFNGKRPDTDRALFIAWNAQVSGEVTLGRDSSVWYGATIRGDIAPIFVGDGTNIQDGCVLHITTDIPLRVGNGVTVGHGVILHSCTVGDNCLIGMGAVVLDRAEIGENSIVGAGSLVTMGKTFPPGSLILGNPAKKVRDLSPEEIQGIRDNGSRYRKNARLTAGSSPVK